MCLLCTHTHILHVSTSGQEFMQFCIIFPKLVLRSSGSTSPADARTARYLEIYCRVLVIEHGNGKSPNSMVVLICFNGKVTWTIFELALGASLAKVLSVDTVTYVQMVRSRHQMPHYAVPFQSFLVELVTCWSWPEVLLRMSTFCCIWVIFCVIYSTW